MTLLLGHCSWTKTRRAGIATAYTCAGKWILRACCESPCLAPEIARTVSAALLPRTNLAESGEGDGVARVLLLSGEGAVWRLALPWLLVAAALVTRPTRL